MLKSNPKLLIQYLMSDVLHGKKAFFLFSNGTNMETGNLCMTALTGRNASILDRHILFSKYTIHSIHPILLRNFLQG